MLNRNVCKDVVDALDSALLNHSDTSQFWESFYEFVIVSYSHDRKNRFSLSEFGKYLIERNISNAEELIQAYFHTIYCIAKFERKRIYGVNFNV